MPAIIFSSVLLPAPLRPTIPTTLATPDLKRDIAQHFLFGVLLFYRSDLGQETQRLIVGSVCLPHFLTEIATARPQPAAWPATFPE